MADLTKLKAQDRQILLVVGPSSVVWRLDDLSQELVNHGINSLSNPADLIDYFDKRPNLFTLVNNHVWSKVAPRKMPSAPKNSKQNTVSVPPPTDKSQTTSEPIVKESSKDNVTNNVKTDIESNPQKGLYFVSFHF